MWSSTGKAKNPWHPSRTTYMWGITWLSPCQRGLHIHRRNITLWSQLQLSVFIFLSAVVALLVLLSQLPAVLSIIVLMSSALRVCWPVGSLWLRVRAGTEQPQTKSWWSCKLEQRRNLVVKRKDASPYWLRTVDVGFWQFHWDSIDVRMLLGNFQLCVKQEQTQICQS